MRAYFLNLLFPMLMASLSIASLVMGEKILLGHLPASLLGFLLILIFGLIFSRYFNFQKITKLFISLSGLVLITFGVFHFAVMLPPTPDWPLQNNYALILNTSLSSLSFVLLGLWVIWGLIILNLKNPQSSQQLPLFRYRHLSWISLVFVGVLLIANITTQKVIQYGWMIVDVGTLYFPITYLFNNIFTEVYGYSVSRKLIWSGLLCNLLIVLLFQITVWLPANSSWPHQQAYQAIAGNVPRIVLASVCGFLCGEFLNSFVLAKLKILTQGRWLWTRTISSTVVGNFIDSIIFNLIAFSAVLPFGVILHIIEWQYGLKVLIEILATPITYAVTNYLKQSEHEDYFDIKTNFNPFRNVF